MADETGSISDGCGGGLQGHPPRGPVTQKPASLGWSSGDHRVEIEALKQKLREAIPPLDTKEDDWMSQSVAIMEFVGEWMAEEQHRHGGSNMDGMMLKGIKVFFEDAKKHRPIRL